MTATQRYRAQHAEIGAIVDQILLLVNDVNLNANALEVRSLISVLAGKLSIHLAMEDRGLYPKLMAHGNPDVRALSTRYAKEMGSLADDFTRFNRRWLTAQHIVNDPSQFLGEMRQVIAALQARIEKENNDLYKLVDNLDE